MRNQTLHAIKPALNLLAAFALLSLTACGGGGDDAPNVDETPFLNLTNFQAASVVIGQANFTDNAGNQGGTVDANTTSTNEGNPGVANGILYLPDTINHRLLGFNTIPTMNDENADFALGQTDLISNNSGTSATEFDNPMTVAFDGGKMFMAEYNNNRVLIWNTIPTAGNIPADVVVGHADLTTSFTGPCENTSLDTPEGMWAVNGKLIVADTSGNRVLIWNSIPTTNNVQADIVLGQNSFTMCQSNDDNQDGIADSTPSARTLRSPRAVWSDGQRLAVVDFFNNRVLIWNSFPTASFTPADVVLGQSDFTHSTANDDNQDDAIDSTPSARTLGGPRTGVYSNGQQLFVADTDNNRVLIWNSFPTANFTPADVVLGQGDFTHKTRNDLDQDGTEDGQASAQTLNGPSGISQSGNQLIVADGNNNRYLIFNE
ncbi:MAG: hypothetical protein OEZ68_19525 [Gammaproteobacteria bacterium]|nr:hypothetical protein [Gammaproteobacteria bacterium]MDH5803000.1 hypothetical protein [Gammaproteobacteria bacterium]